MGRRYPFFIVFLTLAGAALTGCSSPLPWPVSPLHPELMAEPGTAVGDGAAASKAAGGVGAAQPMTRDQAMEAIAGHYAHYDVVSYQDDTTKTTMRTFVISYGFTDFYIQDGKLFQKDRFLHAEYKINQKNVRSIFKDESVQAIKPRVQEVELTYRDGAWRILRPPSPTLLGIRGDPDLPLSRDPKDPNLIDPDGDGNPGVTVDLIISNAIRGKIYITRREIYTGHLSLLPDGRLAGWVEDASEQFTVGANLGFLRQQTNPVQVGGPGMNPLLLVPIDEGIDTWEKLRTIADGIFPAEPSFDGTVLPRSQNSK